MKVSTTTFLICFLAVNSLAGREGKKGLFGRIFSKKEEKVQESSTLTVMPDFKPGKSANVDIQKSFEASGVQERVRQRVMELTQELENSQRAVSAPSKSKEKCSLNGVDSTVSTAWIEEVKNVVKREDTVPNIAAVCNFSDESKALDVRNIGASIDRKANFDSVQGDVVDSEGKKVAHTQNIIDNEEVFKKAPQSTSGINNVDQNVIDCEEKFLTTYNAQRVYRGNQIIFRIKTKYVTEEYDTYQYEYAIVTPQEGKDKVVFKTETEMDKDKRMFEEGKGEFEGLTE